MSGCADGDNLEYLSVSEAVGTAKEVLGTQYENLVLPGKIDIESVNELYTVKADYKKKIDIRGVGKALSDSSSFEEKQYGDIWINDVNTWELPTYAAISAMGYLTSIPSEYVTDTELSNISNVGF